MRRSSQVPPQRYPTPSGSSHRARFFAVSGFILLGLVVSGAWLAGFGDSESGEPNAAAPVVDTSVPVIDEVFTPTPILPTPTVTPLPPTSTPNTLGVESRELQPCDPLCLVRFDSGSATDPLLAGLGVSSAYTHGDRLWTGLEEDVIATLRAGGAPLEVLGGVKDSTALYVVRIPEGVDPEVVLEAGVVLDAAGDQFIVEISGGPPYVESLTDRGVSVEKLPPLLPARRSVETDKAPIGDPWSVVADISVSQLEQRITDLEHIGGQDGQLGTRQYETQGNVDAAEYLYRRLASYGLDVWYEDFIADNGRLNLNVVAEIPGSDPSKIYLVVAHFDSIAEDISGSDLAPGALDNGSGLAVALEIARVLSGYELEHPVHIAFLNAEEYALQGAYWFARNAVQVEQRPYAGGFNLDSVGASLGINQLYTNSTEASEFLATLLQDVNSRWGMGIDIYPRQSDKIIADDTELSNMGIPMVMASSVLYGDPMINSSTDTLDQVDPWYAQVVAQLITLTLIELAG